MPEREHVLLINLGRGNPRNPTGYEVTTYSFDDGVTVTTSLAGLALWRWLVDRGRAPRSVVFACTTVAWRDKEQAVHAEVRSLNLPAERLAKTIPLEVPRSPEQVWATFPPIEQWLASLGAAPESPITLHMDLTHAYRAIPIAHTWMALYLQRRGMIIPGVWGYGAFESGVPGPTPFLDLSHLLDLAEWATAIDDFRRRFDTHRLGQLLRRNERMGSSAMVREGRLDQAEIDARRPLRKLFEAATAAGDSFAVGLPIETGLEIAGHLGATTAKQVEDGGHRWLPALAPVVKSLFDELHPLAAEIKPRAARPKEQLALTRREIDRQLRLVRLWLRVGAVGDALQALRELVVNRVLLAQAKNGAPALWLEREVREGAEGLLNALRPPRPNDPPVPARSQQSLAAIGDLWLDICNARNDFAHVGMSQGVVPPASRRQQAAKLVEEFSRLVWADEPTADWALRGVPPVRSST